MTNDEYKTEQAKWSQERIDAIKDSDDEQDDMSDPLLDEEGATITVRLNERGNVTRMVVSPV
jgi:hypothetical protein